jgi:uncharacterized lipoprotein YddW (UPF0748 family)
MSLRFFGFRSAVSTLVFLLLAWPKFGQNLFATESPGRIGVYVGFEKVYKSPEALRNTMKRIKRTGIDFIHCSGKDHAIFWDSRLAPNELVKDRTYMEKVLNCAHEEGLKVYPVFCVAIEGGESGPNSLLQRNSTWAFFYEGARRGYIDPGNPEARRYEASLAAELVSKYNIDGLSLDYARCPNRIGYTDSGRLEFLKQHNVDLAKVVGAGDAALDTEGGKKAAPSNSAVRSQPIWPEWRKWRVEQVNNLVRELGASVKKAKPGLPISSYVWGYHTYTGNYEVCQDWVTWINEGILDWINPSGYRYDDASFRQAAQLNREHVPTNFPYYITIGVRTSHGSLKGAAEIRNQMRMAAEAGADGLVFFTWEALSPFADELKEDIKNYRRRDRAPISPDK